MPHRSAVVHFETMIRNPENFDPLEVRTAFVNYSGPETLKGDVQEAIRFLSTRLSVRVSQGTTHSVLLVDNFDEECTMEAIAVYLVASVAQSIKHNLHIREALFDEEHFRLDLRRDVHSVIGETDSDEQFIITRRDPWMWEAISHMLIYLSRKSCAFHPSGRILAKTNVKHDVTGHGLDVIAIYETPQDRRIGISAGECKAYFQDPERGISDASTKLAEVDQNKRDVDIRATVSQLSGFLDADAYSKLAGAFWREERSYLPFICCDKTVTKQWSSARSSLGRLSVPVRRKLLIPIALSAARKKFATMAHLMRKYIQLKERPNDV